MHTMYQSFRQDIGSKQIRKYTSNGGKYLVLVSQSYYNHKQWHKTSEIYHVTVLLTGSPNLRFSRVPFEDSGKESVMALIALADSQQSFPFCGV